MSKSVWRAPKAFVATTIGLISTLIIAVPPASAAVTTINIVADSLTYPAGSSVIPTLTAQVSAASGALVTCKVYATSDTSFLTPIDMAGIPTGTNTTYKIHCTATAASASYAIGTITDGVLTVKPNNPLSCTSDFYQVRGGAFFKLNANSTPAFTYNAWGANSITSFNGMGWNQEDNYLYGSDGSGSGKYIYQLAADGSTFAKFVLYTNTANPAGASAAYVPTHLAAATTVASKNTGGDFYTFNGQQYLVQASSSGMDVIDVRSRTVVQTMTSSAWAAYDIAFKGNVGYGVNNSATASTLYIGTVSGTDPKTATVTVTTKTLSALVGSASENFGAAYMDSDGNLFAYGNTSNKLYEISKTELAKTNPAGVLITTATGATGTMNDGASCGTAASPSAPTMTTTTPATLIKSTTATVAGTITTPNLAGSDVVSGKAWLCYATTTALLSTSPTCNSVSGAIAQGTSTPAALSVGLTGLSPGTTYYFQSKATNSAGSTAYGSVQSFATLNSWTITAGNFTYTIGGSVPTITATATPSGGINGVASCAVYATGAGYTSALTISSLSAGTYVTHCTATTAAGYDSPTNVDGTLNVTSLTGWSITGDTGSYQTPGTAPAASGTATPAGGLSGSLSCNYYATSDSSYSSPVTISNSTSPGTYNVRCTGTPASGYAAASLNNGVLTVTASTWALQAQSASYTIGSGSVPTLTASATPAAGLSGSYSCAIYTRSDTLYTSALTLGDSLSSGTYVIHCTGAAATGYAAATLTDATLTVSTLNSWTLNAQAASFTVGGSTPSLTATATPSGGMSGQPSCAVYSVSDTGYATPLTMSSLGAGSYVIRCTASSTSGYASPSINNATLTVSAVTSYNVTFDSQGGSAASGTTYSTGGSVTLPSSPTRSGYSFAGWFAASSGGSALTSPYSPSGSGDITLYAHWTASTYNVTFDSQGGSAASGSTYSTGGSVTLPVDPTRSGYSFAGWFAASSGGSALTSPYSPSGSGDITLYAHWTANTYAVHYDSRGGAVVGDGSYLFSQSFTVAAGPLRSGYNFVNWYDAISGGNAYVGTVTPGTPGDISLYAHWTANAYNVTFDSQGGSAASGSTYSTGGSLTLPVDPTRSGYSFAGWFAAATGGSSLSSPYSPSGSGDITLYAHWTANTYNVTFDSQGGSAASGSTYSTGGSVTLPSNPTRSGYSFAGWFAAATGGSSLSSPYSPSGSGDITLYAHWTANTYNVTFDSQGGSAASGSTYFTGGSVALPSDPTQSGYSFAGWFAASTGGAALASPYSPAGYGDITLYAQWTVLVGDLVHFNSQGGTPVADDSYSAGGSIALTDVPTRVGYAFAGWYETSTGGTALSSPYSPPGSGDITLYAQWTANTYNVTFDSQGGSAVTSSTYSTGGSFALPTGPTRSGYSFAGWFAASAGGLALTSPHSPSGTGDLNLYAHWTANSYVVQYDSQGGASVGDGSYIFGQGFSVAGATTRSGYNFVNWFDALSGGTSFSGTVIPGSPGDISLYAHWTAKSYNVTFDSQGGSAVSSSTYSTGGSVALPSNPTRSGYSFAGWFAAASGGAALSTPYSPTGVGDITLYAHWTAGNYIVHFDSASGSAVADRAYRTGGTVSLPSAPTRLGYSFAGWFAASSGGAALASPYSPSGSGDITLYAHWTATTYNVTFNSQGGSAVAGSTYSTGGSVPLPSSPTRSGYTFAGWFAGSTSGSSLTSPYAPSATGDITIYAQWTANTYTVRYDSRGGSFVGDGSYLFGQSFTVAGGATRSGFNFVNWFDAVTGGTAFVGTVTPGSAGDISLYAHWSALSYNVTFDSQGGSTVSNLQYSTGGSLALPAAPTRSGFIFAGWFAAPSGGSALASPFSPQGTGDITLYAQWTLARLPQTISMPRIGNQLLAVRSLEVHPTASSGLDVVLVSMTPNECGVDEFIVNLDAVGTCRLKASQAGDSTYLPEVVISTFLILAPSISGSPIPTPTPTVVSSPTPSSTPSVSQTPTPSPSPTTPSNGSGVRRVTFDELPQDVTAGFEPSAMLHIEVTGARTAGQFVLTPGGVADAVGIAAALRDSAPNNAADFASVTTVQVVSQVPSSYQIFHASISSDIDKVFAESGLENPRSVSDIAVGSTSWLNVKGRVTGYVPGSVVYMIVTTRPTILQAVVVGVNGMATLSGFVPLDGLPSGPHNIRIVGTRQLQGATATASGTQKLDAHAVHEVGRFDPGTQATVVVRGTSSSGGQFTAIREVLLDKKIAWWTLLLALLFSLAGLITVALRRPASRRFTYAVALLSVASALPAAVIGWNTSSYVLWWAIPIALVAAVLQVLTGVRKNKG